MAFQVGQRLWKSMMFPIKPIVSTINFIHCCQFQEFLSEIEAEYPDLKKNQIGSQYGGEVGGPEVPSSQIQQY